MKNTTMFKRIAMSTMLMSAIAAPAFANAASNPMADVLPAATIKTDKVAKLVPALKTIQFADPLEAARLYAPETLEDWKVTLDKYNKLNKISEGRTISLVDAKGTIKLSDNVANEIKVVDSVKATAASVSMEKIDLGQYEIKELPSIKPAPGSDVTITLSKNTTGSTVGTKATRIDAIKLNTASAAAVSATDSSPIFSGQVALSKALESKDAATIKPVLADLLQAYKDEVAKQ
ncbi:hypothetical protein [Cohnella herbarum]|uniref:Uncharacterized protein n=1 Tax=Cohnella herbarum TaxID=2728023 RepID=A0A7Z2VG78_9BACL|nr:hypothetical protein [Cohnella herbarum]QJD82509.1 hypothetical protein HH215_04430 [Cohnella herbarum]